MIKSLVLLAIITGLAVSISPAYAQHHSGALAPPIDFDGMAVALSSILSPEDFTLGDADTANLEIRFFDSISNKSIEKVTYRIQIFQEDKLVANEYFFDEDGKLDLEIRPTDKGCENQELWKCTKYFGEKHPIAGGYYARGDSRPIIQGPVFDQSGNYSVKVSIVGATNPKTMTTSDLHFETFLSIPERQTFLVQTANAEEFPILIKSFDNKVLNFNYDESLNKISYEVPFEHLHDAQHDNTKSRQNIYLQKDFSGLKEGHDIEVYVEGVKLEKIFFVDVYSPNENILRLEIPHKQISQIQKELGLNESESGRMKIDILSGKETRMNNLDFIFDNGNTAVVSFNEESKSEQEIPFTFSFYNSDGNLTKDILFAYSISNSLGNEIWSNIGNSGTYLGILVPSGIHKESAYIPSDGNYQLKIILTGHRTKNYESFFVANSDFSIVSQNIIKEKPNAGEIPGWIKNNAGWWAKGIVGDNEFVQSVQFLIKEGILVIPNTANQLEVAQEIPDWIKNNAGWWANDLISDSDFMKGIQFLVEKGIVKINQ